MLKILCLYFCIFVVLVNSQDQYQLLSTCPFTAPQSYGGMYGTQPLIMQPTPYSQQYIVPNPVPNYPTPTNPPITNQLEEMYLKRLLSNPAIQAFIDPSTKIYNQNGVEISDQIRPKGTPNVVNNYFIVPTDYLKSIETKQRDVRRNNNEKAAYVASTSKINNPTQRRPASINSEKGKGLKNNEYESIQAREAKTHVNNARRTTNNNRKTNQNRQYSESSTKKPQKINNNLTERDIILNDQDLIDNNKINKAKTHPKIENYNKKENIKQKCKLENTCKREKNVVKEKHEQEQPQLQSSPLKPNQCKSSACLPKELFDISEECGELDNRNIRNPVDNVLIEPHKKSSKKQDNFMNQWMSYIQSFAPNQNFDSFDFSNGNIPFNFEQMYQLPKNSGAHRNDKNHSTNNRKRKQHRKNKPKAENNSKLSSNNKTKKTTIELVPKHTGIESQEPTIQHIIKEEVVTKPSLEAPITRSLEVTHYLPEESADDALPIMYDIIDYYPDFTKDTIYTSEEDDIYSFHNRHIYNTNDNEKELNRDRRRYERKHDDYNSKRSENRRVNDITISEIDNKKAHLKPVFEDIKFQTPPALIEPGFETKRVNMQENSRNSYHTYYLEENDGSHTHADNQKNDVETVFARSKVVKYGQQRDVEPKPKVLVEDDHRHNRDRKHHATDGDTTVVFAQSWN